MRKIDGDALKITLDTFATIVGFSGVYDRGQVMECIDAAPTVATDTNVPGKWISVEARLPDTKLKREKWVLVSLVNNNNGHRWETPVVAEYVTRDKEWFFAGCDIDDVTVTHWTHLPEPPEEVTGDE